MIIHLRRLGGTYREISQRMRKRIALHFCAGLLCLGFSMVSAFGVFAQDVPPKTLKDLQQDGYISELQTQQAVDTQEVTALLTSVNALKNEQTRDEGFCTGAFGILTLLHGLGLLGDWTRGKREGRGNKSGS